MVVPYPMVHVFPEPIQHGLFVHRWQATFIKSPVNIFCEFHSNIFGNIHPVAESFSGNLFHVCIDRLAKYFLGSGLEHLIALRVTARMHDIILT